MENIENEREFCIDEDYYCSACGSHSHRCDAQTGFCYECGADAWEEEYYDSFCMQHDLDIKAKALKLFEEQMDYLVRKGSIYDNAAIEHVKETFKTKLYD